jgi:hypothetical protein
MREMPPIRALREREIRTRFNRSRVEIYPTGIWKANLLPHHLYILHMEELQE